MIPVTFIDPSNYLGTHAISFPNSTSLGYWVTYRKKLSNGHQNEPSKRQRVDDVFPLLDGQEDRKNMTLLLHPFLLTWHLPVKAVSSI